MSYKCIFVIGAALLTVSLAAQDNLELNSAKEKVSYALGMQMGSDFRKQDPDLDLATIVRGLEEAYNGTKTLLTEEEMRAVLADAKEEYEKKQATIREKQAEATLEEGERFLAANKNKDGVVTLPTGLQYKILTQGKGDKPEIDEHVVCNYRGTLLDGTEFDSSNKHNGPSTFSVRGVIKGWEQALLMMSEGSKWQLFVPAQLAYGKEGAPSMKVPPNAALIFELELVSVKEDEDEDRNRQ